MRKLWFWVVCVALLCSGLSAIGADVAELKKELEGIGKQRRDVQRQLGQIRGKLARTEGAAALKKATEAAEKAFNDKLNKDPAVIAARKAQARVAADWEQVIARRLDANDDAAALRRQIAELNNKKLDVMYKADLAKFRVTNRYSPIQRRLDRNRDLARMRKEAGRDKKAIEAYNKARKARLAELPEARELLAAIEAGKDEARKFDREIRRARQGLGRIRAAIQRSKDVDVLALRKKLGEAGKAVAAAQKSEEFALARKAGGDAREAYNAKIKELLDADSQAADLKVKLKALDEQAKGLQEQIRAASREKPGE